MKSQRVNNVESASVECEEDSLQLADVISALAAKLGRTANTTERLQETLTPTQFQTLKSDQVFLIELQNLDRVTQVLRDASSLLEAVARGTPQTCISGYDTLYSAMTLEEMRKEILPKGRAPHPSEDAPSDITLF